MNNIGNSNVVENNESVATRALHASIISALLSLVSVGIVVALSAGLYNAWYSTPSTQVQNEGKTLKSLEATPGYILDETGREGVVLQVT